MKILYCDQCQKETYKVTGLEDNHLGYWYKDYFFCSPEHMVEYIMTYYGLKFDAPKVVKQ